VLVVEPLIDELPYALASGSHLSVVDASSAEKLIPELDNWLSALIFQPMIV
jgi:hypothetical protein